jgi:acyl-CoA oxidase
LSTTAVLQECQEAIGGKVIYQNRIDALKNDTEIYTTFEGDNTVLMQLVAKIVYPNSGNHLAKWMPWE